MARCIDGFSVGRDAVSPAALSKAAGLMQTGCYTSIGEDPSLRWLAAAAGCAEDLTRGVAERRIGGSNIEAGGLCRLSGPAKRALRAELLQLLGRCAAAHLERGPEGPGRHRVNPDALGRQLLGHRLGKVQHGSARQGVV